MGIWLGSLLHVKAESTPSRGIRLSRQKPLGNKFLWWGHQQRWPTGLLSSSQACHRPCLAKCAKKKKMFMATSFVFLSITASSKGQGRLKLNQDRGQGSRRAWARARSNEVENVHTAGSITMHLYKQQGPPHPSLSRPNCLAELFFFTVLLPVLPDQY